MAERMLDDVRRRWSGGDGETESEPALSVCSVSTGNVSEDTEIAPSGLSGDDTEDYHDWGEEDTGMSWGPCRMCSRFANGKYCVLHKGGESGRRSVEVWGAKAAGAQEGAAGGSDEECEEWKDGASSGSSVPAPLVCVRQDNQGVPSPHRRATNMEDLPVLVLGKDGIWEDPLSDIVDEADGMDGSDE